MQDGSAGFADWRRGLAARYELVLRYAAARVGGLITVYFNFSSSLAFQGARGSVITGLHQLSILPSLLRHPRASRQEVLRFQARQLRRVITHAYDTVPYYRRLFDEAGVRPETIRTATDLTRIPVTTRRKLQELPPEDLLSQGFDPSQLLSQSTSGSSGEPLVVRRTWWEERMLGFLRLRTLVQCGVRLNDKVALVSFHLRPRPPKSALQRLIATAIPIEQHEISCLLSPEGILDAMEKIQPDVLAGYSGSLATVAKTVATSGRLSIHPRLIVCGSEVLTPLMARQISEAFHAPVYDTYASHEFGGIACECKTTGNYHVVDDGLILEVLQEGQPVALGGRGAVVGTSLHAYAMPFIRYELGDVVTRAADSCACGQPFSTLSGIQGRMIDFCPLPDGRTIHPYELLKVVRDDAYAWMHQYQFVQERRDRIVLRYVPRRPPSPDEEGRLRERLSQLFGPEVDFALRAVDDIASEPHGKFRIYRSLVASLYEGEA